MITKVLKDLEIKENIVRQVKNSTKKLNKKITKI